MGHHVPEVVTLYAAVSSQAEVVQDTHVYHEDKYIRRKRDIMQIQPTNHFILQVWRLASRVLDVGYQLEDIVRQLKAHFKVLDYIIKKTRSKENNKSLLTLKDLPAEVALEFRVANLKYQLYATKLRKEIEVLSKTLMELKRRAVRYTRIYQETFTAVSDECSSRVIVGERNPFFLTYPEFIRLLFELSFGKAEALDCISKVERYAQSIQVIRHMIY